MLPQLLHLADDGRDAPGQALPLLVSRFPKPRRAIASSPLGGGIGVRNWVINATVPMTYARTDPGTHLQSLADGIGLPGPGVGMLTGVDVAERVVATDGGVLVVATVGLGSPGWAAAPDGDHHHLPRVGTVNIVAGIPVAMTDAALVNAVATVAEAKAQALWSLGIAATGTATDAVCVTCAGGGPAEPFGGPRSTWGARLARAVYRALVEGGTAWGAGGRAWSDRAASTEVASTEAASTEVASTEAASTEAASAEVAPAEARDGSGGASPPS